ncbi:MAG TPA: hypothetical protein VH144_03790 [Candidatus Saccharimonadales bacterium]|jgi:hypothetical protein|nr:hypothetical protein [Candidatus Saccharimonadales bacterium]
MKKATKTKKTARRPLLHELLISVSYNGTVTRTLLAVIYFACLLLVSTFATASIAANAWFPISNAVGTFVTVSLLFLAYDSIYMTVTKIYQLPKVIDYILCFGVELGFLIFVFLPLYTTTDTYLDPALGIVLMFSPLFVLCARVLIGVWMNQAHKKRA